MTAPKRVVQLTTVHHPTDPRIYHKESKSLKKAGFDVTLIAQTNENDNIQDKPIRHIPLKKYNSRIKRMTIGIYDAYKKAKYLKADVYHFHDPELLPVGWLLKRKDNVVIYDIHEDYTTSILQKDYASMPMKKLLAKFYKWMERFFARDAALCLAEKYYKDIYPTGVCILNYPMTNDKFLNSKREGPAEYKLLYTGNVTLERGAMEHARIPLLDEDIEVHIVGKCPSSIAEKMYQAAGDNKERLLIEGIDQFIEKEVIESHYLNTNWLAGIALFPPTEHYMKKELTKFFEYMNAGLPIICSNFPEWEKFMETYECGIAVDPYDDEAVKEAISYLRNNPEEARRMGENGKRAVKEELNWGTEEEKLIAWYNELLGQATRKQEGIDA
ncbi:glycosyltransferase [Oceanobacillus sp. FSL H7-0719]|uniref:glycosyltransferase n=1 Tax=Oceanobacillus sp. FSL H7-0719 TaxID=2954507 RepID=UPI00324CB356